MNREDARSRLAQLIEQALVEPKKRAKTRVNRVGKEQRIKAEEGARHGQGEPRQGRLVSLTFRLGGRKGAPGWRRRARRLNCFGPYAPLPTYWE
jgi:hypothetical protein